MSTKPLIMQAGLQYDKLAATCKACGTRMVVLANLRSGMKLATCPNLKIKAKDPRAADHSKKRKRLDSTGCEHAGVPIEVDIPLQGERKGGDLVFDWGILDDDS